MSSAKPTPVLVLSPTPPQPEVRHFFQNRIGSELSFTDLPALRRSGLVAGLSALRRTRVHSVIVTGSPTELPLFRDYLVTLAFLVPAATRRRQLPGGESSPLRYWQLGNSILRLGAGAVAGVASVAATWLRVLWLRSQRFVPRRLGDSRRCLYLKPMLSFGAGVGGSVAHVAGVVNALMRAGLDLRLLSAHDQPLVEPSARQVVVKPDFMIAFPFEVNQYRYEGVFVREAAAQAHRERPDFLYQRYGLNDTSGLALRRRLGLPLVLEFNGSEVWSQRHWGRRLRFERLADAIERVNLRHADLIVVVSRALVDQAVSMGASAERVLFYPNGIDPHLFDPARFSDDDRRAVRKELGVPETARLLTFVGTFGRWHGTDLLAEAIRRLIDEQRGWLEGRGIHFLYVGDGDLAPKVRSILGPGSGAPHVTLTGFQPQTQTPRILAASDILLSPHVPNPDGTPFFGSPTKLFEYMAMGKLIVASDLDQIGWVLKGWRPGEPPPPAGDTRDSGAAILVEPGSLEELLRGIRQAAELSETERDARGREARRLVLQSFTWDKNVEAVLERLRGGATTLRPTGETGNRRDEPSRGPFEGQGC
jgi:glycosyltransferase involved in cell wall biosynthesis